MQEEEINIFKICELRFLIYQGVKIQKPKWIQDFLTRHIIKILTYLKVFQRNFHWNRTLNLPLILCNKK